eukprot:GFUD01011731.1.p1 GENE.GFUD01011731.1~~GFUD01011731.1.p1  ORF type:complete len:270 (+),score=90.62 GFUD01011731.1:63-812(+)
MSVFNCSRVLLGSAGWRDSRRLLSSTSVRRKAIENWKRPSIGEIGVPTEVWQAVHSKNQKRFNIQLVAGVGLFGVTILTAYKTIFTNSTPEFLHKTGFVTILPKDEELLSSDLQASPTEYIGVVEETVKAVEAVVEEVVDVVKETLDVVKETIESIDEVVEEVKKIEDETKAIVEEVKEIAADTSKLVSDVEEVVKEGAEIITEVKDVIEIVKEGAEIITDVKDVIEIVSTAAEEKTTKTNNEEASSSE